MRPPACPRAPFLVPHTLLLPRPHPILLEGALHGDRRALSHVPAMEQLWGQHPVPVWAPMVLPAMSPSSAAQLGATRLRHAEQGALG